MGLGSGLGLGLGLGLRLRLGLGLGSVAHGVLSAPSPENSLMKTPPMKTHTSENCAATASLFSSLFLLGCMGHC